MGKIMFFGGKGGVGKTSCSTAFAIAKANTGNKVILISTDPAHSISDLFNRKIGSELTKIDENLFGIEIDPEKESKKYISKIRGSLNTIISPIIMEELNKQLDAASVSPGTHESSLFDRMIQIIINESDNYDYLVFDTAPTGHTLRLLSLPEMLGAWMESLIKKREKTINLKNMIGREKTEEDPIIRILTKRKTNLEKGRKIMIDDNNLTFSFVLNAEKMPIEETKKAVNALNKYGINVSTLVVNKILPENPVEEFWKNKKREEEKYLKIIEKEIAIENVYKIPLFEFDMDENTINEMAKIFE